MAALAVDDEHLPASTIQITEAQAEDFATAQSAEHHRFEHRSIPPPPTRRQQRVDLGRLGHSRQRPRCADQRHTTLTTVP